MTYEKITRSTAEDKTEHPARRAARMIRDLHTDNIDLMDRGHVFMRDGVDVSEEMRKQCEAQIKLCDEIMARAENMDPLHWSPSLQLCEEVSALVGEETARRDKLKTNPEEGDEQEVLGSMLPEIGDYGHGK